VDGGSPPPPARPTARVTIDRLNVRGGPGLNYDIISVFRWGSAHLLLGRSADSSWLQIRLPYTGPTFAEPTGWVLASYIWSSVPIHTLPITDGGSPPPPENRVGIVSVPRLNVRSGPGQGYDIIGWARQGLQLRVVGRSSDSLWLKVTRGPNRQGWVYASYVSIVGPYSSLPVVE
ncbi:MAG TPA: SH3 domain-containing protein, partial [Anaerolineae bacterium]